MSKIEAHEAFAQFRVYKIFFIATIPLMISCSSNAARGPSNDGSLTPHGQEKREDTDGGLSEKDAIRLAEASLREKGMLYAKYTAKARRKDRDEWRVEINAIPPGPREFKVVEIKHSGKTIIIEPGK